MKQEYQENLIQGCCSIDSCFVYVVKINYCVNLRRDIEFVTFLWNIIVCRERERERERETDRQTQTDTHTETDRHTDRQTEIDRDRDRDLNNET